MPNSCRGTQRHVVSNPPMDKGESHQKSKRYGKVQLRNNESTIRDAFYVVDYLAAVLQFSCFEIFDECTITFNIKMPISITRSAK